MFRLRRAGVAREIEGASPAFDPVLDPSGTAMRGIPVPGTGKEQENRAFGYRCRSPPVRCPLPVVIPMVDCRELLDRNPYCY